MENACQGLGSLTDKREKETYFSSEVQIWFSGNKRSCFFCPNAQSVLSSSPLDSIVSPSSSLPSPIPASFPSSAHGPPEDSFLSFSGTSDDGLHPHFCPSQPALCGALRTPHVSMAPPAAALQDSFLFLGRSSRTPWRAVMVRRLGVVAGHAENVGYSPVPMGDMDIQWVLQSLSSEQSSTGKRKTKRHKSGEMRHEKSWLPGEELGLQESGV